MVAEVDVDRASGRIWARKFTVAHDCGQIINPDGLVEDASRATSCRASAARCGRRSTFDKQAVTSVDWLTYPILDIAETPETIDCVLINRPEAAPTGAGEPSIRPVAAAIANAIFDATGVRIRRVPFSPDRVKAGAACDVAHRSSPSPRSARSAAGGREGRLHESACCVPPLTLPAIRFAHRGG